MRDPRVEDRATADQAVESLFRDHCLRVARLAYLLTGDAAVAEELTQEAFVRVWRAWDAIRDEGAAYAYLRKTVVNLSRSFLRRKALEIRHRVRRLDDAIEVDPASKVDMLGAVAQLPRRQRACIVLRFYEDLSESETARVLGISTGAVKSQTFKALRRLEQIMGGDDDGN